MLSQNNLTPNQGLREQYMDTKSSDLIFTDQILNDNFSQFTVLKPNVYCINKL